MSTTPEVFSWEHSPQRGKLMNAVRVTKASELNVSTLQLRRLRFWYQPHPADLRIRQAIQRCQHTLLPETHHIAGAHSRWSPSSWACRCHVGRVRRSRGACQRRASAFGGPQRIDDRFEMYWLQVMGIICYNIQRTTIANDVADKPFRLQMEPKIRYTSGGVSHWPANW